MVCLRTHRRRARPHLPGQGAHRRIPALGLRRSRRLDGCRVAGIARRSIHTSTFLGHPVGCAMALAQIKEIERLNLCKRSAELGEFLLKELSKVQGPKSKVICKSRGLGLMAGVELRLFDGRPATDAAMQAIKACCSADTFFCPKANTAMSSVLHRRSPSPRRNCQRPSAHSRRF